MSKLKVLMDQNNIGHGSLLAFILAYGWGALLFVTFIASLGFGVYWIATTLFAKIQKEDGVKRIKTIAWTVLIVGSIALTSLGLFIHPGGR